MTQISSRPLTRREALAALGAVTLAACFSDRATEPDEGEAVEVAMVDIAFEPATVEIRVGERVRWRNLDQVTHTATCDPAQVNDPENVRLPAGAAAWDSGAVPQGGTFSHVFDTAGEYRYFCIPHEPHMVGTIIVS